MIAGAGGERRKHFSDAQLFIAPSLPSVFLMADPAPSHAPRSGARRKILRLLAITPRTTQRADAPLAPEGLAQRRAADSGPRRARVALHHDVPHATSPVGDTVEALYAERNDRQIRLLQVAKRRRGSCSTTSSRLQQLVLNLCLNTIQSIDPGGELTVRVADSRKGTDARFSSKRRTADLASLACRRPHSAASSQSRGGQQMVISRSALQRAD